ncbi:MAG: TonB-dependent receptor [Gammaproteobacteria bacterium]|nr:TonB-dependent receptor [Gammaproteobacteria bacterium]
MGSRTTGRIVGMALIAAGAGAGAVQAAEGEATEPLQEVVVTGIRGSLEKSLEIKRDASVILDSINATELGRFPDADVADSLEHLPGITLSRTTGGEGVKVNVRGFAPQYNVVTLNKRLLATDDDARDLAFDVLPSELISGADVLKTFDAATVEGSIGGTVNLRTASPFDTPGLHAGAHLEGNYNQMSRLWGQRYSAFVSNTFADGMLGAQLGLVYSDNKLRTDTLNNNNQLLNSVDGTVTGAPYITGIPGANAPFIAAPYAIAFGSIYDQKKREAVSGSLEWRPADTFKLILDGLYTHLNDPQHGQNQSYYFPFSPGLWTNPVIDNDVLTGITSSQFQPEIVNNTINRKVNTSMVGLNGSWKATPVLDIGFDLYHSAADRPEGGTDNYVSVGLASPQGMPLDTLIFQDRPNSLPSINVVVPPSQLGLSACPGSTASAQVAGQCSYTALMNSGYLNNNNYWSTHYVELNGYSIKDRVNSGEIDGKLRVEWGPLTQLRFGLTQTNRDKTRVDSNNDWTGGSLQYLSLYLTLPPQTGPYTFGSRGYNVLTFTQPPNFMHGAGGSFPSVLPLVNVGQLLAFLQSLDGLPNPYGATPGTVFNFASTLPQVDPFNSYQVSEKTSSAFLQADFLDSQRWSGNVGVRLVHTKTEAQYALAVPVDVWAFTTNAGGYFVDYKTSLQQQSSGRYTEALPAANVAFWVVPREVQLRAGISETIARPNLNQLAPNANNQAIGGRAIINYTGTAGLKPIKSTNYDLSLEWYYAPHATVALALFDKEVRDDIYVGATNNVDLGTLEYIGGPPGTAGVTGKPFPWTVYAPANGAKSRYSGVELTWQHILDNGFGAHAQVTYTRSNSYDQNGNSTGPVNAVPPTTASVSLIYEKGPVSAAVNYDWTSSFRQACALCTEIPGWPAISDHFEWVTATLRYRFTERLEAYVEGKNLTDSIARTYLNGNRNLVWANGENVGQSFSGVGVGYSAYGRSYALGVAYRF